ncbi:hypothetical protein NHQ30_010754 [Ciborinia camelliae]|nr:hypothetical protein NHQ30_010754 [Ciborinia camelliae]
MESSSQYDSIGHHYSAIKNQQATCFELAAIRTHIGDITGLRILDLACGAGFYTRKLVEWGAKTVVGIDISAAMIEAARIHCGANYRHFEFWIADCSKPLLNMGENFKFDIVLAIWFLDYAENEKELLAMWRNIFSALKPGGRCLAIVPNFEYLHSGFPSASRHGVTRKILHPVEHGVKFQVTVHERDENSKPLVFEAYMWERELYEKCARRVGMEMRWMEFVDPMVEGLDFEGFLEMPHFQFFVAWRPGGERDGFFKG